MYFVQSLRLGSATLSKAYSSGLLYEGASMRNMYLSEPPVASTWKVVGLPSFVSSHEALRVTGPLEAVSEWIVFSEIV